MATDALTFDNLRKVLEAYGAKAQELYRYNLALKRKNASRKLSDSVEYVVKEDDQAFTVSLSLEDYWQYIEHGRKPGKFPPTDAILSWIKVKPIIPRPMMSASVSGLGHKNTRIPKPEQLAYLIGRKIARDGIEPTPIMETTSKQVYDQFLADIRIALKKDIEDYFSVVTVSRPSL